MKITRVSKHTYYYIETDADVFPTFRRNSASDWENLMGESWELAYACEELEALFQIKRKEIED